MGSLAPLRHLSVTAVPAAFTSTRAQSVAPAVSEGHIGRDAARKDGAGFTVVPDQAVGGRLDVAVDQANAVPIVLIAGVEDEEELMLAGTDCAVAGVVAVAFDAEGGAEAAEPEALEEDGAVAADEAAREPEFAGGGVDGVGAGGVVRGVVGPA